MVGFRVNSLWVVNALAVVSRNSLKTMKFFEERLYSQKLWVIGCGAAVMGGVHGEGHRL